MRTYLALLLMTSAVGHADVLLKDPNWAQSGSVSLSIAFGDPAAKPHFEVLKIEKLEVGKSESVTSGAITAVVRSIPGVGDEKSLMTIAVTIDGFVSKAGVPLTALFVAGEGADHQYTLINKTPILDSAALFEKDLHFYQAGLKKLWGCSTVGAYVVLTKYAQKFPTRLILQAKIDAENGAYSKSTGETCAELPEEIRVIDPNGATPAAGAKADLAAAPVARKSRYTKLPDGRLWDTKTNQEYVDPAARRLRQQQQQDPYAADGSGNQDDARGYDPRGYGNRGGNQNYESGGYGSRGAGGVQGYGGQGYGNQGYGGQGYGNQGY